MQPRALFFTFLSVWLLTAFSTAAAQDGTAPGDPAPPPTDPALQFLLGVPQAEAELAQAPEPEPGRAQAANRLDAAFEILPRSLTSAVLISWA